MGLHRLPLAWNLMSLDVPVIIFDYKLIKCVIDYKDENHSHLSIDVIILF